MHFTATLTGKRRAGIWDGVNATTYAKPAASALGSEPPIALLLKSRYVSDVIVARTDGADAAT